MKRFFLPVSFFFLGFLATNTQIILVRELFVVFFGNEIVLALIFFWWFFSVGLGAYAFSLTSKKVQNAGFYFLCLCLLMLIPEFQVFLARSLRTLSGTEPGQWVFVRHLFFYSGIVTGPLGFLIGFIFPLAAAIASQKVDTLSKHPKQAAGLVYSFESLGSMSAGLLTSLLMLKYFGHIPILIGVAIGGFAVLSALAFILFETKKVRTAWILFAVFLCLGLIATGSGLNEDTLILRWKSLSVAERIGEKNSVYQNISIGKQANQYSIYGNGSYITSFPDEFAQEFTANLFMSLHPHPEKILVLSEGSEEMIEYMLAYKPKRIDLVQLDAQIHEEIYKYLPESSRLSLKSPSVSLVFLDPRKFLVEKSKNRGGKYDLIISLAPDPTTLNLNRFFTAEFFEQARSVIKDDGIFVTKVSSTENYLYGDVGKYIGSVFKTARLVFPHIFVIPGTTAYLVCSPSDKNLTYDLDKIFRRFEDENVRPKHFRKYHLSRLFQQIRIEKADDVLRKNMESYKTNRDFTPVAFLYSLKILAEHSGHIANRALGFFTKLNVFHYLSMLLGLLILRIIYSILFYRGRNRVLKFNSVLTIATTGFLGFACQLIILYFYQARYGYIYLKIGVVVGFFMLGLFLGSLTGNRAIKSIPAGSTKALIIAEIILGLFVLSLPFIFKAFPSEGVIFIASLFTGFLTGAEFVLANKIYFEQTDLVKAASLIDSLDHFGAGLGALVSGIILIPTLGITLTCIILFALKTGCILLWVLAGPRLTKLNL